MEITIREAKNNDAPAVLGILDSVVKERNRSAIDREFTLEDEERFIKGLKGREKMFVAEVNGKVIGCQAVTVHQKSLGSTGHVATTDTYVLKNYRGKGVGSALIEESFKFAKKHGYIKFSTQVRATNKAGLKFYQKHGFKKVGKYSKQVKIDGKYDDEILMEKFLE